MRIRCNNRERQSAEQSNGCSGGFGHSDLVQYGDESQFLVRTNSRWPVLWIGAHIAKRFRVVPGFCDVSSGHEFRKHLGHIYACQVPFLRNELQGSRDEYRRKRRLCPSCGDVHAKRGFYDASRGCPLRWFGGYQPSIWCGRRSRVALEIRFRRAAQSRRHAGQHYGLERAIRLPDKQFHYESGLHNDVIWDDCRWWILLDSTGYRWCWNGQLADARRDWHNELR